MILAPGKNKKTPVICNFNSRVFSTAAFLRGHKRDTNPTPCLRLSSSSSSSSRSLFPLLHWCCYLPRWWCHRLSRARASLPKTGRPQSRFDRLGRSSKAAFPLFFSWVLVGSRGWRKRRDRYQAPAGSDLLSPWWKREAASRGSARPGGEQRRRRRCPRSWIIEQTSSTNRAASRYWHCGGRIAFISEPIVPPLMQF